MDNNINDIDKFFKDRLDGLESPNVPSAWDSMAAMLDADDKGAAIAAKNVNRFIIASIAGAIVLAGSVIGYISGYGDNTNTFATKGSTNNTTIIAEAPATNNTTENSTTKNNTSTTDNASIIDNSAATVDAPTPKPTKTDSASAVETPKVNTTPIAETKTPATPINTEKSTPTKTTPNPIVIVEEEEKKPSKDIIEENVEPVAKPKSVSSFSKRTFSTILLKNKPTVLNTNIEGLANINDANVPHVVLLDSAQKAHKKLNKMARFYRLQFGIQAGGNFNRVISNTTNGFELGSGMMAGFFLSKNLSKKWAMNAEFNYFRSTGHAISRTIKQTEFFLEKTSTNFFLVTKTFDYLQLPLSVSFSPTDVHKFDFGVSTSLMVNAKTEVAENKERFNEKSSVTETKAGVYEDLNTFNYGLLIGYEYNLPGMYSIGLRYNQMFSDITNNSYFNDDKKHLPANVQLFVKLNLTR